MHLAEKTIGKSRFVVLIAVLLLTILSSGCGRKYAFRSEPAEASLYLNDAYVGKTPIDVSIGDLPPTPNIRVRLSKEGFIPFTGVLPGTSISTLSSDIYIAMTRGEDETDKLNRNMMRVINAQKLVLTQRYPEALKLAEEALEENPRYIYAQLLKASILFLSKQYTPAMKEYQKVLEMDPANTEAIRMINYLKSTGGTMPADPNAVLKGAQQGGATR